MKYVILLILVSVMVSAMDASVTQQVSKSNGEYDVTITVERGSDDPVGVITVTLPEGYSLGSAIPDYTGIQGVIDYDSGDKIEAAFLMPNQVSSGTLTFEVVAGTESGYIQTKIQWGDGETETLTPYCMKVDGKNCETVPSGGTATFPWLIIIVVVGVIAMMNRK